MTNPYRIGQTVLDLSDKRIGKVVPNRYTDILLDYLYRDHDARVRIVWADGTELCYPVDLVSLPTSGFRHIIPVPDNATQDQITALMNLLK